MVPQLAQGFLHPRIRGRTGKPQRLHVGRSAGRRGSAAAGDKVANADIMPSPAEENDCPPAPPPRCPAVSSPKPIGPGKKWVGEPFDADRGIQTVPAMHHGRVGQREELILNGSHERGGVASRQVRSPH
jgi:hypothetical protein